jgi:glycosyltransferase involved in cell wall biosynthesis
MEVDLSVIVPCFNEEANIKELARRVLRTFERGELEGELVLVDDGSSDRTADIIRQVEREHPAQVVVRFHLSHRGIDRALKTGVATSGSIASSESTASTSFRAGGAPWAANAGLATVSVADSIIYSTPPLG